MGMVLPNTGTHRAGITPLMGASVRKVLRRPAMPATALPPLLRTHTLDILLLSSSKISTRLGRPTPMATLLLPSSKISTHSDRRIPLATLLLLSQKAFLPTDHLLLQLVATPLLPSNKGTMTMIHKVLMVPQTLLVNTRRHKGLTKGNRFMVSRRNLMIIEIKLEFFFKYFFLIYIYIYTPIFSLVVSDVLKNRKKN